MAEGQTQAEQQETAPSMPSRPGYSGQAIHLVRTSQQINLMLSQMADTKASILMGATFLFCTLSVGQATNGTMPWALAVLALFAFVSAMCAVFAVLPSVSSPASARRKDGNPNKLFFGHFAHMAEDAWTDSILDERHADETVFRTMLPDVYQNGLELQRKKYKFVAYSCKSFMVGLTLTAITFAVEYGVQLG